MPGAVGESVRQPLYKRMVEAFLFRRLPYGGEVVGEHGRHVANAPKKRVRVEPEIGREPSPLTWPDIPQPVVSADMGDCIANAN